MDNVCDINLDIVEKLLYLTADPNYILQARFYDIYRNKWTDWYLKNGDENPEIDQPTTPLKMCVQIF